MAHQLQMHAADVILLWTQESYIQAVIHIEAKYRLHLLIKPIKSERVKTHIGSKVHASIVLHTK